MRKVAVSFTGGKDSVLALHLAANSITLTCSGTLPNSLGTPTGSSCSEGIRALAAGPTGAIAARRVISLLATFAPAGRSTGQGFKAHPIPVIRAQACALQIPHIICNIDPSDTLESYRQQIRQLHQQHSISELVTGDILDVADGFMSQATEGTGVQLVTPLWQLPRRVVLSALFGLRVESIISCINLERYTHGTDARLHHRHSVGQQSELHASQPAAATLARQPKSLSMAEEQVTTNTSAAATDKHQVEIGDAWDAAKALLAQRLTAELVSGPLTEAQELFGADLCGEHGEYHTLVYNAPLFKKPLDLRVQRLVTSGLYAYVEWDQSRLTNSVS